MFVAIALWLFIIY